MRDDDHIFWDRLAAMPWLEAEQECVSRREYCALQLSMLNAERSKCVRPKERDALGLEVFDVASQLTLLNERIKYLRKVQDRAAWAKAVTAIYGQEGFDACRNWMASTEYEIARREGKQ